jgi:uncharacterized membrane protein YjjP (DUF1212 family)
VGHPVLSTQQYSRIQLVWVTGRYSTKEIVAWLPASTGFVAGALATCTKLWIQELNVVILDAILVLIPGYPIIVGVAEVVSNHLVSTTVKIACRH